MGAEMRSGEIAPQAGNRPSGRPRSADYRTRLAIHRYRGDDRPTVMK